MVNSMIICTWKIPYYKQINSDLIVKCHKTIKMNVPGYKSSLLLAVITVATEIFSACIESGEIKTDQTMPIFSVFGRLGEWDSLILSMVFVGVTAILMYRRRRERMTLLKTCGIPGPTPHFFIGNLKQCFSQGNVQFDTELTEKFVFTTQII